MWKHIPTNKVFINQPIVCILQLKHKSWKNVWFMSSTLMFFLLQIFKLWPPQKITNWNISSKCLILNQKKLEFLVFEKFITFLLCPNCIIILLMFGKGFGQISKNCSISTLTSKNWKEKKNIDPCVNPTWTYLNMGQLCFIGMIYIDILTLPRGGIYV